MAEDKKMTGYPSIGKPRNKVFTDREHSEERKLANPFQPDCKPFFWTMIRTEFIQNRFNHTPAWMYPIRYWLFKKLVAEIDGKPFFIAGPIRFQQGCFTHIGKNFYGGPNLIILDHGGFLSATMQCSARM